jgi:AcrR family transcriptional regulator
MNKQPEVRARTRERIVEAFFSLYEGRSLREVTVGEVAAAAHVNRSTFYEYFDSVFDLLDQVEKELVEKVRQTASEAIEEGSPLDAASFAGRGAGLFEAIGGRLSILVSHPDSAFSDRLVEEMRPLMGPALGVNLDDPHASLVVSFVLSGLVGCLSRWHASGETIPRGELAVLLQRVMAGVLTVLGSGRDGSSLYEERMARALVESRRDYSEGRVYASREELMEGIAQRRAARG